MDRPSPGIPGDDGIANSAATQDADATFFKVMSENLKYAFNSPLPTTQFPTPYSNQTQQQESSQQQHLVVGHSHQQQQYQQGLLGRSDVNNGNSDSSLVENSMLAGLPVNVATGPSGEPLNDINMQPSSVLQFGNTFSNEFLLASPEQFREFLLDSPAGFNLFHKTPAKTPLRFVTDARESNVQQETAADSGDLFGIAGGKLNGSDGDANTEVFNDNDHTNNNDNKNKNDSTNNNNNTNKSAHDISHLDGSGMIPHINTQTPLRSIDLNLMFNSSHLTSSSPSKKFSVSLTPYGRRVLNDMGTPYAKNALLSSNSALADFQKARKHNVKLQSTPPTSFRPYQRSADRNRNPGVLGSLYREIDPLASQQGENDENDVYGSSPTTIQLNSSVTKSAIKLEPGRVLLPMGKVEGHNNKNNIDEQLFTNEEEDRLPVSPTPKCHNNNNDNTDNSKKNKNNSKSNNKNNDDDGSLRIPELPKMGSFKSDSSIVGSGASGASNHTTYNSRPGKVKKNTKKQPKFQIIVANTQKFNVPTMNQKSSKKNGGLKRSQSLLSNSSASGTSSRSQRRNTGDDNNPTSTNNNIGEHPANGTKRSISFTSRKGQFDGFR